MPHRTEIRHDQAVPGFPNGLTPHLKLATSTGSCWYLLCTVLLAVVITVTPRLSDAVAYISGSVGTAPSSVNLSVEGVSDWAAWGNPDATGFNHKSGVTQQISNFTTVGAGIPRKFTAAKSSYSWSDGTPLASATNTYSVVRIKELGAGFEITVPADTANRTLKVYVGARAAKGRFEARLSDGGNTPAYVGYVDRVSGSTTAVFALNYQAASAGQTLTVQYTVDAKYNITDGHISLEGATLQGAAPAGGEPPVLVSIGNQTVYADSSLIVWLSATNPNASSLPRITIDSTQPTVDSKQLTIDSHVVTTGGAGLSYSASALPSFVTLIDNGNGTGSLVLSPGAIDVGSYSITVLVTDVVTGLSDESSFTITVNPIASLSGSMSTAPANVNLTVEGASDWAAWGTPDVSGFNNKSGVTRQISNFTVVGAGIPRKHTAKKSSYSWIDGAPIASTTDNYNVVRIIELGGGFEITVPADAANRTLKVYVGAKRAKGRFEATLSGSNTPAYVGYVNQASGQTTAVFTLDYQSSSAGQTLTVRYTLDTKYDSQYGQISMEGAALQSSAP